MNLNKAFILGNLTRDPELRTLPSGGQVAGFGVATNRYWRDKEGNRKEEVQFHNIVAFGKLAELAGKYLTKGGMVFVEGRIQNRSYDDKAGQKRYISEVVAEAIQLGPRRSQTETPAAPAAPAEESPFDKEVPVVSEEEETPKKKGKPKPAAAKSAGEKKDDDFEIEEDIPF